MSLPVLGLYLLVGFVEWFLALRRIRACADGEKGLLVLLVFVENLLGLVVLVSLVRSNDWVVAVVYSLGAALGAITVDCKKKDTESEKDLIREGMCDP